MSRPFSSRSRLSRRSRARLAVPAVIAAALLTTASAGVASACHRPKIPVQPCGGGECTQQPKVPTCHWNCGEKKRPVTRIKERVVTKIVIKTEAGKCSEGDASCRTVTKTPSFTG